MVRKLTELLIDLPLIKQTRGCAARVCFIRGRSLLANYDLRHQWQRSDLNLLDRDLIAHPS